MRRLMWLAVVVVVGEVGCTADDAGPDDVKPDTISADTAAVDVGDTAPPVDTAPTWLAAADYCETIAPFFCPYYMRCGRMAVADEAACRSVMSEVCNVGYEPLYASLEASGLVKLSRAGVEACAAHLASVPCSQQLSDLDGGCAGMWVGQAGAGALCGPGLESLVCDDGTTCVLGLDFCGTCKASSPVAGPCDADLRCEADARCVNGACLQRPRPDERCDDAVPCVVGASCVEGTCRGWEVVALGDPCDQARRCPYKSACVAGRCVEQVLLGEACSAQAPCASGDCSAGRCVAASAAPWLCLDP